ncbi:acyl-CoA dehydrogenase family protein [Gymnodinialimonas sp. 57CJ19]|uniref:acyl-CoA dehydrogenase family protein n=1 Tax=Gymnodinialimonas sp. 57CJ19 TaxID=3138498 RepID=UPI003134456E
MQFVFTQEQLMMSEMVQGFLTEHCTTADLRKLAASEGCFDQARWQGLVDLGLLGALMPEAQGGLALSGPDVVDIAQACGAALLPEPLLNVMGVVLPALSSLGQKALIADVLAGSTHVAVSHPDARLVDGADRASHFLIMDTDRVRLAAAANVTLTPQPTIDPLRRLLTVTSTSADVVAEGDAAAQVTNQAADAGAFFAAAQLLGIAQKAIDISVAYACERTQFGKPIGVNQALKHHLASAQVAVEFARPVLHAASALLPGAGQATSARISHAKIACGRAADLATRTAIQVHGGMGYSQEADVHLYLKRTLALRRTFGTETHHRNRYAARLDALPFAPDTLFPQETSHA